MRTFYSIIAFIALTIFSLPLNAGRLERTLNEAWTFELEKDGTAPVIVNIPHTWNSLDCFDEQGGFFRGKGKYSKTFYVNEDIASHSFYLKFEGANQHAQVYVNGTLAGEHKGGYTAFGFDITGMLETGANELVVVLDNSHDPDIPPLSADFTFFGGIYRDVSLVITDRLHISTTHYATDGVYITTPAVNASEGRMHIVTRLSNDTGISEKLLLTQSLYSPAGECVATVSSKIVLPANAREQVYENDITVDSPVLWDLDDPEMYRLETVLSDRKGVQKDAVSSRMGFRWFKFDPDNGFFLNGTHRRLAGTNRHQDYLEMGNALPDERHVADIEELAQLGGNFLRISHYPQDPIVPQMCDKLGIVASVEIPVVNCITVSDEFTANSRNMVTEMVYQSYNSPAVMIWCYMNEVLLNAVWNGKDASFKDVYRNALKEFASGIDALIKELDPYRYTMEVYNSDLNSYQAFGLTEIPDILGWNLYQGWYSEGLAGFGSFMDRAHKTFPDKVMMLTEYGADMDPRLHSFNPLRFDYTCEYGSVYHKHYIPEILSRDFIAASAVWNLNDFYSESRTDGIPHINNKGLSDIGREKKDAYYLYKANLSKDPFVKIGAEAWVNRGGLTVDGVCVQQVDVFSNQPEVELSLNGKSLGTKKTATGFVTFDVPFRDGDNTLVAKASGQIEARTVKFAGYPEKIGPDFKELNVLMGTERYYDDRKGGIAWIPEKEYSEGSWGYVGGELKKSRSGKWCADIDIRGTEDDPLWQTQRGGLEHFKADVPDGEYYVYLYFAEWNSNSARARSLYALGSDAPQDRLSDRVFDVSINGDVVLDDFDIVNEAGAQRAVIKKCRVDVSGGEGLDIAFNASRGEAILNAVRIYRAW